MAKGLAMLWGLKIAHSMGVDKLQVEGDSKIIIEVAIGRSNSSWKLKDIMDDIVYLLSGFK